MPTTVDFGTIALAAGATNVFVPDAIGVNIPPGLNFSNIEVHIGLTQIPDGCFFAWDVEWSLNTGNSTQWDHQGGASMTLPTHTKDGALATEAVQGQGIVFGARRGRFHVKQCSLASTISVSVTAFP